MRVLIQSMACAVLLALGGATAAPAQDSKIVMVPNDDPEMASAQAKARATLAEFWKAMDAGGPLIRAGHATWTGVRGNR